MSRRSSTVGKPKSRRAPSGARADVGSATGGDLLHLDAFSGIAGNMFLGALLDAGLPRRELSAVLAGLAVEHRMVVRRVMRGAIAAKHVSIAVPKAGRRHGRHFREIRALLRKAKLDAAIRTRSLAIFEALAEAEAKVHGIPVERVHFHEVGAVDAIVDITGAAAAIEILGIRRVTATPLALGHGSVETAHGRLPLPAPATLELLRHCPVSPAHIEWETVTPTGAALVRVLVDDFCAFPQMVVARIGHGAGEDRSGGLPNVLRAVIGQSGSLSGDRVLVVDTHIDDMNPEHFDYAMDRLFAAGALDVGFHPLQMKKNRPGFALRVIAAPEAVQRVAAVLFAETTTAGLRMTEAERLLLHRRVVRVRTPYGSIRVKILSGGALPHRAPEYDDCKRAAEAHDVPLKQVVQAAEAAAQDR